ncbi:hypothetical protein N7466_006309 [Penicillium verhagenii]|uniref:uncharacterized protein n=1 Tax=Penicillium verhagenii TaxID=1562060 RepID=UPI002544D5F2|nr:uncharacterized protein N7466_006309 [Penicillium verhagenii]KAJ5930816.1 hypothetical protein N7466_006309 [Penicillium verhagenii]
MLIVLGVVVLLALVAVGAYLVAKKWESKALQRRAVEKKAWTMEQEETVVEIAIYANPLTVKALEDPEPLLPLPLHFIGGQLPPEQALSLSHLANAAGAAKAGVRFLVPPPGYEIRTSGAAGKA